MRGLTRPRFFCVGYNCLSAIEKKCTGRLEDGKGKSRYFIQTFEHSNIQTFSQLELLVRGKKSFGHVKIDAKRVSDSGVLCTVVDLHKREEL